ncbi:coiled-coil domain-containing protein 90B, mitochondrial isoform X3 [Panthera tigris]|uniref:coiled-coil domain-containing protein 90B, mitochondrial isoform X3 n=1 Tax=Panthera leo TaxID=9689 RepID=UPI001C694B26|nr:coiled-coil domain-containing protein 90B, mitochondrial isoform X3 [Panthera leo]XP_042813790.1 coiled-coil domain-containing protein 90B, mitochondrial isoform X3 [Panthera tigris]XP_049508945.1 coiled-coil domain-containing protein 90B, mitochondrial isoform X3 [Panthera uncia]
MWSRSVWRLLCSDGRAGRRVSILGGRFSPALRRDFFTTTTKEGYDMRRVDLTPLEQRKLTFDTHALVQDLETHGFDKAQAETIVSALTTLSNVSLDSIYKEMVTRAQQEITVQQLMAHLDSIRKDMVILEKSEFANLRAENQKMKTELEQVKQQLINETSQIRADNKLDINLERSRVTDMIKKRNLWKQPQNLPKILSVYMPGNSIGILQNLEIAEKLLYSSTAGHCY